MFLRKAMKSLGLVLDVPFHTLLETMEKSDEFILEGVQALTWNTSYSYCRIVLLSGLKHVFLPVPDTSHFVEPLFAVTDVGRTGHWICSVVQIKNSYEMLVGKVRTAVEQESVVEGGESQSQGNMFS